MTLLFSSLTVIRGVTEMNKMALLVLFMLFAFCRTSHAHEIDLNVTMLDVITLNDGSVFEGRQVRKDEVETMFRVADGIVGIKSTDIVSVELRNPTADEKARLIRFKTERYDATYESDFVTPFELDVVRLYVFGCEGKLPEKTCVKILAEKLDLPPIIVQWILEFKMNTFFPLVAPTGDEEEFFGVQ